MGNWCFPGEQISEQKKQNEGWFDATTGPVDIGRPEPISMEEALGRNKKPNKDGERISMSNGNEDSLPESLEDLIQESKESEIEKKLKNSDESLKNKQEDDIVNSVDEIDEIDQIFPEDIPLPPSPMKERKASFALQHELMRPEASLPMAVKETTQQEQEENQTLDIAFIKEEEVITEEKRNEIDELLQELFEVSCDEGNQGPAMPVKDEEKAHVKQDSMEVHMKDATEPTQYQKETADEKEVYDVVSVKDSSEESTMNDNDQSKKNVTVISEISKQDAPETLEKEPVSFMSNTEDENDSNTRVTRLIKAFETTKTEKDDSSEETSASPVVDAAEDESEVKAKVDTKETGKEIGMKAIGDAEKQEEKVEQQEKKSSRRRSKRKQTIAV